MTQGAEVNRAYHGPRFETFDMSISAANAGCGIALAPRFLIEPDLAERRLVLAAAHELQSVGQYYVAYAEPMADTPKIRALLDWVQARSHSPIG